MIKVLLLDHVRIQDDELRGVRWREGTSPKVGDAAQVWLDDERCREGKVARVYVDEEGRLFFDVELAPLSPTVTSPQMPDERGNLGGGNKE